MPVFTDSHCHFDFAAFDADRQSLWDACWQAGIRRLIIPGIAPSQWQQLPALIDSLTGTPPRGGAASGIFYATGWHPWWLTATPATGMKLSGGVQSGCAQSGCAQSDDPAVISEQIFKDTLARHSQHPACIAIGECGLDGMIEVPSSLQEKVLHWHFQMAEALQLPLILHCRKRHSELLALIKNYRVRGVIHAFSGSVELARQYTDKHFLLGVGGVITWPRASKTREALRQVAPEFLLLETDAPDMPLAGFQGQRNSPLQLPTVARTLAELRNTSLEQLAVACEDNINRLFFSSLRL